jgi:hypothetical protein
MRAASRAGTAEERAGNGGEPGRSSIAGKYPALLTTTVPSGKNSETARRPPPPEWVARIERAASQKVLSVSSIWLGRGTSRGTTPRSTLCFLSIPGTRLNIQCLAERSGRPLIIRRSWVRSPAAPPSLTCGNRATDSGAVGPGRGGGWPWYGRRAGQRAGHWRPSWRAGLAPPGRVRAVVSLVHGQCLADGRVREAVLEGAAFGPRGQQHGLWVYGAGARRAAGGAVP